MRKIKNANLAQLLMQIRFTPEAKRRRELVAAENLYCLIDPGKQYPYDFVCFHITGFHTRNGDDDELIDGSDLRDDLYVFISKLSGKLATPVSDESERVYTAEELAARFNVSTKTIRLSGIDGREVRPRTPAARDPGGHVSPPDEQTAAASRPAGP